MPPAKLQWAPYNVRPAPPQIMSLENDTNVVFGATFGGNNTRISYIGKTSDAATCAALCLGDSGCDAYTWHDGAPVCTPPREPMPEWQRPTDDQLFNVCQPPVPVQPRLLGVYPSRHQGGSYSCRSVHPDPTMTTAQVLRSADGHRNTAFHVVTTRKTRTVHPSSEGGNGAI